MKKTNDKIKVFLKTLFNFLSYFYFILFNKNRNIDESYFDFIKVRNQKLLNKNLNKLLKGFFYKIKFNFYHNQLRFFFAENNSSANFFFKKYFGITNSIFTKPNLLFQDRFFKKLLYYESHFKQCKNIVHFGSSTSYFNFFLKKKFPKAKYFNIDFSKKVTIINKQLFEKYGIKNLNLDIDNIPFYLRKKKISNIIIYSSAAFCYVPPRKFELFLKKMKKFTKVIIFLFEPGQEKHKSLEFKNPLLFNLKLEDRCKRLGWNIVLLKNINQKTNIDKYKFAFIKNF